MSLVHKVEQWGDTHHPKVLDLIRIALGIFLLLKGIAFLDNMAYLKGLIDDQQAVHFSPDVLVALIYYVTFAHLVGGTLILLGTLTRFACIIQIPIVLAAVFLSGVFQEPVNAMLWPSLIALVLLSVFMIVGSGPWSLDSYLENWGKGEEVCSRQYAVAAF